MTISTTFFRGADATRTRSISSFGSAGSGVMAAGSTGPSGGIGYLYSASTNAITGLTVAGTQPQLGDMFVFSDTRAASGSWVVQSSGSIAHFSGVMGGTLITVTTNMGYLNSGVSTASGIFLMDYSGTISNYVSAWALVTTNAIPNTGPYYDLNYDGNVNLYCLSQTTVQKLALASATSGTWSSMSTPFTGLFDGLLMNSANPIVFGRIPLTTTDLATDAVEDSATSQFLTIDSSPHQMTVSIFDTYGNLSTSASLSMSGVPKYLALALNQALVTDTTNNTLSIYQSTAGTWSGPTQSLTCSGAAKVNTSSDGTEAIVCQPSQNSIQGFKVSAGTWSSVGTTAISGATDVALVSSTQAYVAGASGVSICALSGSWVLGVTIRTTVPVTALVFDSYATGIAYTCGTSAGSGFVYAVNTATSAISSSVYSGSADDITYSNGYIAVLDNSNKLIRVYNYVNGVLSSGTNLTLPAQPTSWTRLRKGQLDRFFVCSNLGWYIFRVRAPWQVVPYYQNIVTQWSGSAWVSAYFGYPRLTTVCTDGTFAYCFRYDNLMIKINTSGVVQAGYPQTVPVYSGQNSNIPLGVSDSVIQNSKIYLSASLGGGIIAISGY